uniref:Uncharacterized protein n=1 Tax=Oryza meridionalis TaxID=40149 RepID=A0A0E0FDY1_9ORYZ
MASAPRVTAVEAADGEHQHGSRRSRRWTASAPRVAAVEAADGPPPPPELRQRGRREDPSPPTRIRRLCRGSGTADADPSPPLLTALSLPLYLVSPPRHRPGPGGRDKAPLSVFVVGRRRLYLCQGEYKLGNRCPQEPVAPNASLGCVAWLKSGERRVPQPGDALHRGEPARTKK